MAKQYTVFKVLRRTSRGLNSCVLPVIYKRSKWCLTYSPDRWTEAPLSTGILVFCSKDTALDFYIRWYFSEVWGVRSFGEVWRVIAEDKVPLPRYRANEADTRFYNRVWTKEIPLLRTIPYWPEGTMAFKRIRLVERVLI